MIRKAFRHAPDCPEPKSAALAQTGLHGDLIGRCPHCLAVGILKPSRTIEQSVTSEVQPQERGQRLRAYSVACVHCETQINVRSSRPAVYRCDACTKSPRKPLTPTTDPVFPHMKENRP